MSSSRIVITALLCAMCVAGAAAVARGQSPPAPAAAVPPPPVAAVPPSPPTVRGSGEFGFVNTAGNAQSTSLGIRGEVICRPRPWLLKWRAGFVRLKTDDTLTSQSFVFLFRGERPVSARLSVYGQYDYLRDLFAGLEHKHVANAGVSYEVVETPRQRLIFDGGVGATNERRLAEDVTAVVLLGGVDYTVKISATTELTEDVRYEQSVDQGEDWRLDNTLAVSAKITTVFSLKVSNVLRYAHAPGRRIRDDRYHHVSGTGREVLRRVTC